MKITFSKQNGLSIDIERTPEEYKLLEQAQLFRQQLKIAKVPTPTDGGGTYNNCIFKEPAIINPIPMMMMQQQQQPKPSAQVTPEFIQRAVEYGKSQTGYTSEMLEKTIDILLQFFKDKGVL